MKFAIPITDDFYYKAQLTNPDGTVRGGLSDVTGSLSASDGGQPITGLTAYAATEVGTNTGIYAITIPGSAMRASSGITPGMRAYVVLYEGSNVLVSDPGLFTTAPRAN